MKDHPHNVTSPSPHPRLDRPHPCTIAVTHVRSSSCMYRRCRPCYVDHPHPYAITVTHVRSFSLIFNMFLPHEDNHNTCKISLANA
jgi:hypothetical protein